MTFSPSVTSDSDPMDCSMTFPGLHCLLEFVQTRPLSRWCHPATSSSVVPFSSCSQSFPASGSFPKSQLFASGAWSIGASPSASVLPVNIQGWYPLGLTDLNAYCPRDSQASCLAPRFKNISSSVPAFFMVQILHLYMTTGKTIALNIRTFVRKLISLLFNMLSRLVIAFLPRSKCLLKFHGCSHYLQWLWSQRK